MSNSNFEVRESGSETFTSHSNKRRYSLSDDRDPDQSEEENSNHKEMTIAFCPRPNNLTFCPLSISKATALPNRKAFNDSITSAADQAAFSRSLEEHYKKLEKWEKECYLSTDKFERQYEEYHVLMKSVVENGGPLPKVPTEPVFSPKPEMPLPPSMAVRSLIQAGKRRGMRLVSRNNFQFNQHHVLNVESRVAAVDSKRIFLRVGIEKAPRPAQGARATSRRADVVERALGSLDVNVIPNCSGYKDTKVRRGMSSTPSFRNLSIRPRVK